MKIIQGDCLDHSKYPEEKVDLILFDPPFKPKSKVYKQIRKENDNQLEPILTPSKETYDQWWESLLEKLQQILKPSGWLIFKSDYYTMLETYQINIKYFEVMRPIVWNKINIGIGTYVRLQEEYICVFRPLEFKDTYWKIKYPKKQTKVQKRNFDRPKHKKRLEYRCLKSIIVEESLRGGYLKKGAKHINQTPIELWEKLIPWFCPKDGLVLDPTAGTGSIGIACKHLSRRYYGIEIEQKYVDMGNKDIEKAYVYETKKETIQKRLI